MVPQQVNYDGFSFDKITLKRGQKSNSKKNLTKGSTSLSSDFSRLGRLTTPHGVVETPNFIFCGTKATVKATFSHRLRPLKTQIILANTYHLMLQPGSELIEKVGGLHKFMGWDGPMLTDSGGYQIFAMGHGSVSEEIKRKSKFNRASLVKTTEEGSWFNSYVDGKKHFLTPEYSMLIQKQLGADLVVQLDECTPYHITPEETMRSMELSMRWGDRSLASFTEHHDGRQAIYGVVQGGVYPELRRRSSQYVVDSPFFGVAVGGSLGKTQPEMFKVVRETMAIIRNSQSGGSKKPVHLLGIGDLEGIFYGVRQGIDTFDCVIPTRLARHFSAIVPAAFHSEAGGKGRNKTRINLKNRTYLYDSEPLPHTVKELKIYSRSYIHHLIKAKELLAIEILSEHNIYQMNLLMEDIRRGIKDDCLDEVEVFWCGKK